MNLRGTVVQLYWRTYDWTCCVITTTCPRFQKEFQPNYGRIEQMLN